MNTRKNTTFSKAAWLCVKQTKKNIPYLILRLLNARDIQTNRTITYSNIQNTNDLETAMD